ncbi:MAG: High-affinity Na(+)/H(+) antiporter NhaS3 [Planctomycetota bacterium]|jgi:Kef-type K+ transport system membrane component KefB
MNNVTLAVHFFAQIAVILVVCRLVGIVAAKLGQPQVVAEMIAGVVLGPSLFGLFFPELQAAIFPWDPSQKSRDTQSYLFPASQLGLALYMFIVGMEFRVDVIRQNLKASAAVSLAGMAAPFVLGALLAAYFFETTELFPKKTSRYEAMLFLGASMCITAFPMLARIIHFKKLSGTLMGTVAIGAGAIDDVTAWCLLALVLASFDGEPTRAISTILGAGAFIAFAVFVLRPLLAKAERFLTQPVTDNGTDREGRELSDVGLVTALVCMSLGAWFTDWLHLHAVFGAFIIGTTIPRGTIATGLTRSLQPLTVALLLPLFFTFSGLNTQIGLLNSAYLWWLCLLVLIVAILGKGVACYFAARATGLDHHESLGIGTLMNARGLMELIIINIGLQRGVISRELFATLVIMAVITTLMASPIFDFAMGKRPAHDRGTPNPSAG